MSKWQSITPRRKHTNKEIMHANIFNQKQSKLLLINWHQSGIVLFCSWKASGWLPFMAEELEAQEWAERRGPRERRGLTEGNGFNKAVTLQKRMSSFCRSLEWDRDRHSKKNILIKNEPPKPRKALVSNADSCLDIKNISFVPCTTKLLRLWCSWKRAVLRVRKQQCVPKRLNIPYMMSFRISSVSFCLERELFQIHLWLS